MGDGNLNSYKEENVTLTLNIYGEFVVLHTDEVASDYQFAIVEGLYNAVNDEDDTDIYRQPLALFMSNGTLARKTYKLYYDDNDDDLTDAELIDAEQDGKNNPLFDGLSVGDFIAFAANSDNEIELEDLVIIDTDSANNDVADYDFVPFTSADDDAKFDTKRILVGTGRYKFADDSVIFNSPAGEDNEIVGWDDLVEDTETDALVTDGLLICENDKIVCIWISDATLASSAADYAVVLKTGETGDIGTKEYENIATILTEDGEEEYEVPAAIDDDVVKKTIISYSTNKDKISAATGETPVKLVDIKAVKDLGTETAMAGIYEHMHDLLADTVCICGNHDADDAITGYVCGDKGCAGAGDAAGTCNLNAAHGAMVAVYANCPENVHTAYVANNIAIVKEAFRVKELDGNTIIYIDDDEETLDAYLPSVDVADDVVVIDISGDTSKFVSYSDVDDGDYVVAFDANDDVEAQLLVIIK